MIESTLVRTVARLTLLSAVFFIPLVSKGQTAKPTVTPSPTPTATPSLQTSIDQVKPITLADALDRATRQTTAVTTADFNTRIASEDVRQARVAFFPKVTAPLNFIYTTPSLANSSPREPAFIDADAITVYQALLNASGEIDTSGKLAATLKKNIALVDAARAGSEVARRDLQQSVVEAYFALALASAKRRGAESNLRAAEEFENNQRLQLEAGEIAPVELVRARLQTTTRRDELLQADSEEIIAEQSLRILIGAAANETVSTNDLLTQIPVAGELDILSSPSTTQRPEITHLEAEKRAADFELSAVKAERLPQITYSVSSGFVSDSLAPGPIKNHAGIQATVGVTVPIFDWGATRSRITQARLRAQAAESAKQIAERQNLLALQTARQQALFAQQRIELLRQAISDAETELATSTARYRAGEAPLTEVIDAQNALVTIRVSFFQALFDYQTAKARLARAAGK